MHVAPSWISLGLVTITAFAPARVVTAPAPVPDAGSPIRYAIRSDPSRFTVGRLVSLDADTLALERLGSGKHADWQMDRIPTDSIAQLQVRIGRRSNIGRGALIGGGIGAGLGLLCAGSYDENEWFSPTPGQCLASGVVSGAAVGALVGALSRSDIWAPVQLPTRVPGESPTLPVTTAVEFEAAVVE